MQCSQRVLAHSAQSLPQSAPELAVLLDTCRDSATLEKLHSKIITSGNTHNVFLATKLIDHYGLHGNLPNAHKVFQNTSHRNHFVWNNIIKAYVCNSNPKNALSLYHQMQGSGTQPTRFTYPYVLRACGLLSDLDMAKIIHSEIQQKNLESNIHLQNAILDTYFKCQSADNARQVFDKMHHRSVVSWTTMISGYAKNDEITKAFVLFREMVANGVVPHRVTMIALLPACNLEQGVLLHKYAIENCVEIDVTIVTALVTMYAKNGRINCAKKLFKKCNKVKDSVLWSAMTAAYAQNGHATEALGLFREMEGVFTKTNEFAAVNALQACAHLAALQDGMWIHQRISRNGFQNNVFVGTALVDMYAKCGNLEMAKDVFEGIPNKNVFSWSAMISGYGVHGRGNDAIGVFEEMLRSGVKPNHVTFSCVLSACSHAGLIEEGLKLYFSMIKDYRISPGVEHHTCMVDLLGRGGLIDEAWGFIQRMGLKPEDSVWDAFLGACRTHGNIDVRNSTTKRPLSENYSVTMSELNAKSECLNMPDISERESI